MITRDVDEWNRWREANPKVVPDLEGADLRDAHLHKANLREANLREANLQRAFLELADLRFANLRLASLQGAQLSGAKLRLANLEEASLQGARMGGASPRGANLRDVSLWGADLQEADLRHADLQQANIQEAVLRGADLRHAILDRTDFRGSDLRDTKLSFLDECCVEGAQFSHDSRDPWSVVRRYYTTPTFFFIFVLLLGASLLPYVGEALLLHDQLLSGSEAADTTVEERPTWFVLVAAHTGWVGCGLASALIGYTLLLGLFTLRISLLSLAEERSGYSPPASAYRLFYRVHQWAMCPLLIVAIIAVCWHLGQWLFATQLPVRGL
jgi:hypothetical protein